MTIATPIELTLIVPAYNERDIIVPNLTELQAWLASNLSSVSTEILVVDDGSRDGMGDVVAAYAASSSMVRLVRHKANFGRGRAIRTGFEHSRGNYVICLDADLSYSPHHIPRLLEPLMRDEADVTLASAYHPEGSVENVPWSRAVLSRWGNNVLSRGVYGRFNTVTCIVRGYNRHALAQLELISDGKDLHLEIIQKALLLGLRVKEVPAQLKWRDRKRRAAAKSRLIDFIPFVSMSGSIASHLIYNYILRPSSLLLWPVLGLLLIAAIGLVMLLGGWVLRIAEAGSLSLATVYTALRETLLQGFLTLQLVIGSILISFVFMAFYFASQQTKKNFEELYILMSRMNERIKQFEKRQDS